MDAAAIEQANRDRKALGLSLLPVPGAAPAAATAAPSTKKSDGEKDDPDDEPASTLETREAQAYDNFSKVQEENDAKRDREARAAAIRKARDRAQMNKRLDGKGIADDDDDDAGDVRSWLKDSKKRQKAIRAGQSKAAAAEAKAAAAAERGADVADVEVGHDAADFLDGDHVLTLKDRGVLDEGEADELEDVALKEREKLEERLKLKRKAPTYDPNDMDETGEGGILSKYDEDISGKKRRFFKLQSTGTSSADITDILESRAPMRRRRTNVDAEILDDAPAPPEAYSLTVRKQPLAARMCGSGERDRRVIDPLPIVQLHIEEGPNLGPAERARLLKWPYSVMHCSIWDETGQHDLSSMSSSDGIDRQNQQGQGVPTVPPTPVGGFIPPALRRLIGNQVANPFIGLDEFGNEGSFFCFPDLSCRTPGTYRLRFSLVVLDPARRIALGNRTDIVAAVMSDPFHVYAAKDFPGVRPRSALARRLEEQGCNHISIKKGNVWTGSISPPGGAAASGGEGGMRSKKDNYLDLSEIKVKKPKKSKKSKPHRQRLADDDDVLFDATQAETAADTSEQAMDVDAGGAPPNKKKKSVEDDFGDDEDLQEYLAAARRRALKKSRTKPVDMAKLVKQEASQSPEPGVGEGGIILDDVKGFVDALQSTDKDEPRQRKPRVETAVTAMDQDSSDEDEEMRDVASVAAAQERAGHSDEADELTATGVEEEKLVSQGIGSTLSLLRDRGVISKDAARQGVELNERVRHSEQFKADLRRHMADFDEQTRQQRERDRQSGRLDRMSARERELWQQQQNTMREQHQSRIMAQLFQRSYQPNVELRYVDGDGRRLSAKEAFKELSHQFHGKGSGKGKTDKLLKRLAEEKRKMAESLLDVSQNVGMSSAATHQGKKRKEAGVRLA